MIQKILVPLDGSGFGEDTLPYAATLARHAQLDIEVAHVHVPHPPDHLLANTQYQYEGVDLAEYDLADRTEEQAYLAGVVAKLGDTSGREVRAVILDGLVADAIDVYTRSTEPGLILMGTHGRTGFSRAWLGSVADALVRQAPWPVLLVRPSCGGCGDPVAPFNHVLIPLDGSERSERIVAPTMDLVAGSETRVRLLQVVRPSAVFGTQVLPVSAGAVAEARRKAIQYLEGVAEGIADRVSAVGIEVIESTQPAQGILEVAERESVDLVALATHGYRGVRRALLGSVADKVLRGADVPLLLLGPGVQN
ncbi:MAG TPA: universal stress protein [Longimicrobiales bacterium]